MLDLPQDIWDLIASHIPYLQLGPLISVNRAFLNIVLDARYKTVEWVVLDKKLISSLGRLQSPYIARRVRRLHIRPWFIQYLLEREKLFEETTRSRVEEEPTWQQQTWTQLGTFLGFPSMHTPETTNHRSFRAKKGSGYVASPNEIMSAMINAVQLMVNVTTYDLRWRDLPLNNDTLALLTSAGAAFSGSLSKLVLHARISRFESFLTLTNFYALNELEFHFDFDFEANADDGAQEEAILVNYIAPYITHLASLRSLTIVSSAKADHSAFLRAMGSVPPLRLLALRIPFNQKHLSDPSTIGHILHLHRSTLSSVELRPNDDYTSKDPSYTALALHNWSAVARQCLVNTGWLGNVESLTIPAVHHPTMFTMIHHTSAHLTSLCLFSRYLEGFEAAEVIGLLGPRVGLRRLSLEVKQLTPELISLLANTLPGLSSLTLVLESDFKVPFMGASFAQQGYEVQADWQLSDISLFFKRIKEESDMPDWGRDHEYQLMTHLAQSVLPNLCGS
ncbi:hypothetical protein FPV67DRAFT_1782820 [Lyophyllum atratum]|nr:hypothetical protein FPV67DRAFT_1782820 [Lyophyllum atratum]